MKSNRRNFLKLSGLAGVGLVGANILPSCIQTIEKGTVSYLDNIRKLSIKQRDQIFNMSGYAAPKMDIVRTGHIGLGRGLTHLTGVSLLEGVEIKALCDLIPEKIEKAKERIAGSGFSPDIYSDDAEGWRKMCDRDDIDLIYIATPWNMHTSMAVYAMEHGKHVCIEVPAATSLEECWQLVETSEKTRKHCMMMENCCYDFFELLTLNMARQGFFGEIVHCEGAYNHNLLEHNFRKTGGYWEMWRLKENAKRNGNLYPTHGLGPVCQVMGINRGDKMDFMVSVTSKDFQMNMTAKELAAEDEFYKEFVDKPYRGNITTSTIRTTCGRTIMVQHDVTSPNVYSRIHKISGTKGAAMKYPLPAKISIGDKWVSDDQYKAIEEEYTPEIIRRVGEMAKQVGGHGGMDFLMNWRTIDCLRNGLPLDQDVYDAALWSSIAPLSEWSVANNSNSIQVPDFTGNSWKTNKPLDLLMEKGGNTKVVRSAPQKES